MKRGFALLAVLALGGVGGARAQNPAWTATLMVQPFPSPFVADWQRNPQMAVLTVLYTGRGSQSFRVEAYARATTGEVGRVISPPQSFAFGPTTQLFTTTDLLTWNTERSNGRYVYTVQRTGRLPEGPLQLCARVLDQNSVQLTSACTNVTIALPDPPQLIFPPSATVVTAAQPVFQWTPVVAPPEIGVTYRMHIVQRLPQQTPAAALAANPAILDQVSSGAPMFTYPVTGLPLETGKEYVWQVEALDQTGLPITRGQGKSEIRTFTVGGPGRPPATLAGFPDTLTIVPGLARLSGLSKAQVTETPFAYELDGSATLELSGASRGPIRVQLDGLTLDKRSLTSPVFTAGSLSGTVPGGMIPASLTGSYVKPTTITYDAHTGFTVAASLVLGGATVPFTGALELTAAGVAGRLTAGDPAGPALATLGADPAQLLIRQASIALPGGALALSGTLSVFGQDPGCAVGSASVDGSGAVTASIACRPQAPVSLVPGDTRLQLALSAISGSFSSSLSAAKTSTTQLTASGQVALDAGGAACGGSVTLTITGSAVTPGPFTPSCDGASAGSDLGWLTAGLSSLRLQRLAYTPGKGFDFAFQVDLTPALTGAPGVQLPQALGVTVDPTGFTIPASQLTGTRGPASLAGFGLKVTRASLGAFTLAWKEWQAHSAAGFAFTIDGTLTYTGLPQGEPACLSGVPLGVTGARLSGGTLTIPVASRSFTPACQLALGGGAALAIQGIGGTASVQLSPQVAVTAAPTITGALILPSFFTCAAAGDRQVALAGPVALSPAGMVTGQVTGLAPRCPIALAAVQLGLTAGTLTLSTDASGAQSALLSGTASGKFTAGVTIVSGSGTIGVDLVHARLASGSLSFPGPFELDLPASPALLGFSVAGASLDTAGLHVDGRAQLLLPGKQTIGVTFDQVVVNPQAVAVTAGKVLFDAPFALEMGTGSGAALTWKPLAAGAALDVTSGLRVNLPGQLSLAAAGLAASGTSAAHVIYGGKDLDSVTATFSQDFALSLSPAGATSGSVAFAWHGAGVATIDAQGFHPNLGALATGVLPARLGLPDTTVAYLQLRDPQGNLLVSSQTTSAGVHITTAPGQALALVMPGLALGRPDAPRMSVTVDVTLDPLGRGVTAGAIKAAVPAGTAGFDLSAAGIPVVIDTVAYAAGGTGSPSFALSGALALFGGRPLGAVTLALDPTGHLTGAVDATLTPADSIPLVTGFGGLALTITRVTGSFGSGGNGQYDLSATGALSIGGGASAPYRVPAVLDVSNQGVKVSGLTLPSGADSLGFADLGVVRLGLSGLRVPTLSFDRTSGKWHFDLVFNAALEFPQLDSLVLPSVTGVELTENGFSIPQINLPQLSLPAVTVAGFSVQPLAFRTKGALSVAWFTGQPPADWGFAFDLGVGFGPAAPAALTGVTLSVLGAGLANGAFTGQIEPPPLSAPIPIPGGSIDGFAGSLAAITQGAGAAAHVSQGIGVTGTGHFSYPALLRCAGAPADTAAAVSGGVSASGHFTGTVSNLAPGCPVHFGPLAARMTASTLTLGDSGGTQTAVLAGTATLKLAAPTTPDSVTATGSLAVDLVEGRVSGGALVLSQPFRWTLPATAPLLTVDVSSGRIDSSGIALSGSAALMVGPGDSIVGTLDGLLLSLTDFSVRRGSLTLTNGFALQAGLDGSANLSWQVVPRSAPAPATGVQIAAPDTVVLDSTGFHLGGSATASFAWGGKTYGPSQMTVRFDSGFALGSSPVAVRRGRATLVTGADTIAVVNPAGFLPGNIFAVATPPDSIPLPSYSVAYVRLKDAQGRSLISTSSVAGGLRLSTTGPAPLVIPALANGGTAPVVNVTFSVTYNTATGKLGNATDSIAVSTPAGGAPLFTSAALGLDVERVAYRNAAGAWSLMADARLHLPASLGSADVRFKDLAVTPQGFSGTATVGTVTTTAPTNPQPVATASVSQNPAVSVQFTGATVTFGSGLSGQVSGQVVAPALSATPIFFSGQFSSRSGLALTVDASSLAALPIGQASFTAQTVGIGVWDSAFTVTLGGIVKVPQLTPDFAVTITGLTVGTHGVRFPSSVTVNGGTPQAFDLFGAHFALQDEGAACPALGVGYTAPVLTLTLSGQITFLGNTGTFCKLSVGSDGSVSIAQGSLLSSSVTLVQNILTLDTLTVKTANGAPALHAAFTATLPAPFASAGPQRGSVNISKAGVSAGALDLTLLGPANAQSISVGDVTGALSDVTLHLNVGTPAPGSQPSAVEAVAELCFKSGSCPRQSGTGHELDLGSVSGNTLLPGVVIGFDGSIKLQNLTLATPDTLGVGVVQLAIQTASAPTGGGFGITLTGGLGLAVSAVTSQVLFKNVSLTPQGVQFGANWLTGGSLTIADVFGITVDNVAFSTKDTTITEAVGSAAATASKISVTSFVRVGGGVSLAGVFTGAVRQVLIYHGTDGSTHVLVDSAGASVPALGSIFATLSYTDAPTGFDILVGGSVTIGTVGVAVVGDVGKIGSTTRIGLFVAAKGLTIPVPGMPVIQIAGLGGGFFLNPTQADIDAVHSACGVQEADLTRLVPPSSPVFSAFLYGEAQIVSTELVDGQALLTVTNNQTWLDGNVTIIKAINNSLVKVTGDLDLGIGYAPPFAVGNISVVATVPDLVDVHAGVQFFVIDANTWGITGTADANLVDFLSIKNGSLFIGPAGFLVKGDIAGTYDFTFFSVTGDFGGELWYFTQTKDWGAYVTLGVDVSVLDGALDAKGSIAGALVGGPGTSPLIYVSGELTASALGHSWTGTVWAQFQSGNLSAGFGDDPAMDAAIADAEAQAQVMQQAGAATQQALAQAKVNQSQVVVPSSALEAAFNAMAGWSAWTYIAKVGLEQSAYEQPHLPTLSTYLTQYDGIARQSGAPADTTRIRVLHDSLTSELTALGGEVGSVSSALQALATQATQLSLAPLPALPTTPPVTATLTTPSMPGIRNGVPTAASGIPTFSVNTTAATAWRSAMTQRKAAAQAYEQQVRQQLTQLETGLQVARAATAVDTGTSFLAFARRYDGVVRMAEEQAARSVNMTLGRRDWAKKQDQWVESQLPTVSGAIYAEPAQLTQSDQSASGRSLLATITRARMTSLCGMLGAGGATLCGQWKTDSIASINGIPPVAAADTAGMGAQHIVCVTVHLVPNCQIYSHDSALVVNHVFTAFDSINAKWADTAGMALWYHLADDGLSGISRTADSVYGATSQALTQQLTLLQSADRSVAQSLGNLADGQAALTGRVHDVYARYLYWKTGPGKAATSGTLTAVTPKTKQASPVPNLDDTAAVRGRIAQLEQDLSVPTLSGVQMTTITSTPYMAGLQFTWTGQHPDGIYEYLFNDVGSSAALTGSYFSAGGAGTQTVYLFTGSATAQNTVSRTFQAGVRAGAGFAGFGRSPYSITFAIPPSAPCTGSSCGTSQVSGGGIAADNTPPTTPVVRFPENPLVVGSDGVSRVWSSDPASIEVAWSAVDNESGVSDYSYFATGQSGWTDAGGRTDVTIDRLPFSARTPVYVTVKAKNGQGGTSVPGASYPVYYDSTGPAWPAGGTLAPPPVPGGGSSAVTVIPVTATYAACPVSAPAFPVASAPAAGTIATTPGLGAVTGGTASGWSGSLAGSTGGSVTSSGATPPQLVLSFPAASDAESGLQDYFWRLDQSPDSTLDPSQWIHLYTSQTSITVSGAPLDYQHQFYVSVMARNHAGGASRPLVYGPFQAPDPSPPTAPTYCAGTGASSGYFAVLVSSPAADPETGVKGYQYRVRDAAGGTVRDFPTGAGVTDWSPVPSNTVVTTAGLTLTGGHRYYVDARAVNWQGRTGPAVTSGPVVYDATPPAAPTASAAYASPAISLTLVTGSDPESGFGGVQVAVGTAATGSDVLPWQTLSGVAAGKSTIQLNTGALTLGTYYVQVRTFNGAGIPSAVFTTSFTLAPQPKQLPIGTPAGRTP